MAQADQQLQTQKLNLRSELDRSIATIGAERGRLETEKGKMRIEILQNYQNLLADVNARNAQFQQGLFTQAQDAVNQLDLLNAQAQKSYKTNIAFDPSKLSKFTTGDTEHALYPKDSGGFYQFKGSLGSNADEDDTGGIPRYSQINDEN
jgi:hypothetical protein